MEKKDLKQPIVWTSPFLLCPTGKSLLLQCNDESKIDAELFANIEYLSEIKEKGLERIKQINETNATEENWLSFRAFVRQAKLYYFSAKEQNPAVSSLNFFYSFLNLVKAYCCLYYPEKVSGHVKHGISLGGSFSDVFTQEINLYTDGIMPMFYELVTKIKLSKTAKFPAQNLLSYCSDITYEYSRSVPSPKINFLYSKIVIVGESKEKMWVLMAVSSLGAITNNESVKKVFEPHFHQIDLNPHQASEIFKIKLDEYPSYSFLQNKSEEFSLVPFLLVAKDYYTRLSPFVSFYPRKFSECFKINLPIKDNNGDDVVLNECLAIYAFMFYVSELVRYNPKIIQDNLSKPQGWLMERFIVNTPQTFLRYMVNLITGDDLLFFT
jgi:hypothetical protein